MFTNSKKERKPVLVVGSMSTHRPWPVQLLEREDKFAVKVVEEAVEIVFAAVALQLMVVLVVPE
jgi:phosphoribosyl-ATP pyrophosphohydrolase